MDVLIAGGTLVSSIRCQCFTGRGVAGGGQVEGLVLVEVPVEEEVGSRSGRQRVAGWAGALEGRVCAAWSGEEPGWEVGCKGEE